MDPSHDEEEEDGNEDEIVANSPPPTYEYDGSVNGFSSTWNPTRPIIEMKFGQVDCNIFQFLKKSTKMEKIVFLYLLLTYLINTSNPEFRVPKSITTPYHFLY